MLPYQLQGTSYTCTLKKSDPRNSYSWTGYILKTLVLFLNLLESLKINVFDLLCYYQRYQKQSENNWISKYKVFQSDVFQSDLFHCQEQNVNILQSWCMPVKQVQCFCMAAVWTVIPVIPGSRNSYRSYTLCSVSIVFPKACQCREKAAVQSQILFKSFGLTACVIHNTSFREGKMPCRICCHLKKYI